MKRSSVAITLGLAASLAATAASAQATLNKVKQRGFLACGFFNPALPGFSMPDAQGKWTGFDIDYCRAHAAAIFNDPTKVRFVPLAGKDWFTALQSAGSTFWCATRPGPCRATHSSASISRR